MSKVCGKIMNGSLETISFTPVTQTTMAIISNVSKILALKSSPVGFHDENLMIRNFNHNQTLAAVIFNQMTPKLLSITLRFPSQLRSLQKGQTCGNFVCLWPMRNSNDLENTNSYDREGFLALQHTIFESWLKFHDKVVVDGKLPSLEFNSIQSSGDIDHSHDQGDTTTNAVWILYYFLYFVPFLNLIWIEWSFGSRCTGNLSGYHLLFLILYSSMLILNALILATFLGENCKSALLLAASLWLASYAIFSVKLGNLDGIDFETVVYLLIFFNNIFPFGMQYLGEHLDEKVPHDVWFLFGIQICAIIFYAFCLQLLKSRSRKLPKESNQSPQGNTNKEEEELLDESINSFYAYAHTNDNWRTFEYGPLDGHLLMLQNMRIFENEISVILAPQGSGKSALISLLAGRQEYEGYVYYKHNKEISKTRLQYCSNIDVTMGHNSLYGHLTVSEQLKYALLFKEMDCDDDFLQTELTKWLVLLKTSIKDSKKLIRTLNYDQKCLLALSCLLAGKTQIILLDEPTRFMELYTRRIYWDILRQERQNRSIIMTTSSIDEANEIADRVGILNNGKLLAWSSPFFLQNNLSRGIYLVLLLIPETPVYPITQLLTKYIASIRIHAQFRDRVTYILPRHKRPLFQRILIDLEKESTNFGISSLYVTEYNLNDIYMDLNDPGQNKSNKQSGSLAQSKTLPFLEEPKHSLSAHHEILTMTALFYKKLLYQASNMVPVLAIFLSLLVIAVIPEMFKNTKSLNRIEISLDSGEFLKNSKNCTYFEISDLSQTQFYWKPQKLLINSLKCGGTKNYHQQIKPGMNYDKVGAVEKIDENHLKLWINERIFHSPAVVLNLAENVILRDLYPNEVHKTLKIANEPIGEPMRAKRYPDNINALSGSIIWGLSNLETESKMRDFCETACSKIKDCEPLGNGCSFVAQCCAKSFLEWSYPGILPSVVFMTLITLVLFIIFISQNLCLKKKMYFPSNKIKQMRSVCYPYDDAQVVAEKIRISNMNMEECKQHTLLVDQLEYCIPKEGNLVKVVSFALKKYDCLGICGVSKSGKTHLITQLIGENGFRFGEVYICGNEIKHETHKALTNIGYLPQNKNHGYFDGATPCQVFTLFLLLQTGVSKSKLLENLKNLSVTFNLRNYMNTRISELPTHIRRRISFAIALIVHKQVLIFDEPTWGLDARERRFLWHIIRKIRENGNTILFTSQESMELEELSDFIIAVNKGEMLTMGSPQSIRQKYTMGFYMEIKLKMDGITLEEIEKNLQKDFENLQRFIAFLHTESELIKRSHNVLKYYLPIENVSYSHLFGTIEKNRERLNILDYMINQGSLVTALDNLYNSQKEKRTFNKAQGIANV
uniref:ABC transporter domain-containing protein n=1 Tax=Musca domestica TaxID=7370 RepID=A0A1I8NCP5_MUSDO